MKRCWWVHERMLSVRRRKADCMINIKCHCSFSSLPVCHWINSRDARNDEYFNSCIKMWVVKLCRFMLQTECINCAVSADIKTSRMAEMWSMCKGIILWRNCDYRSRHYRPCYLFPISKCTLCLKKNIPDIFSYNSRKHRQIFIIFGRNVTKKPSNHTLLYFSTSPN